MREIKFRAWNPLANAFRPVSLLDMENMIKDMEWKQNCLWLRNTERSIYEQFTGLHDKNGEDIYEGSNVSVKNSELGLDIKGVVIFENGYFGIKVPNIAETLPLYGFDSILLLD